MEAVRLSDDIVAINKFMSKHTNLSYMIVADAKDHKELKTINEKTNEEMTLYAEKIKPSYSQSFIPVFKIYIGNSKKLGIEEVMKAYKKIKNKWIHDEIELYPIITSFDDEREKEDLRKSKTPFNISPCGYKNKGTGRFDAYLINGNKIPQRFESPTDAFRALFFNDKEKAKKLGNSQASKATNKIFKKKETDSIITFNGINSYVILCLRGFDPSNIIASLEIQEVRIEAFKEFNKENVKEIVKTSFSV